MEKLIILTLTVGAILGCTNNDDISDINIRLSNISNLNFENIIVNPGSSKTINYGDLDSRMTSGYKNFEKAYRYGFVELTANGKKYSIAPIDYDGETPLSDGNYTYELNLENRQTGYTELTINLIKY